MMRLGQTLSRLSQHLEKLRTKCLDFSNGVVQALMEEEMKIRREETDERIRRGDQRKEPHRA